MPLAVAQLFGGEKKNMFSSDDGTRSAKTTVFQKIVNLQIDFLRCLEKFEN